MIQRFNRSIHKSGKYFSVTKRESWVLSFNSLYLEQLWLRIRLSSLYLARWALGIIYASSRLRFSNSVLILWVAVVVL
jgi:hypothetical protein